MHLRGSQTPDSKKEEFRKYLEKSGVIDALTRGALPPVVVAVAVPCRCATFLPATLARVE
jgi:hypothetical protein